LNWESVWFWPSIMPGILSGEGRSIALGLELQVPGQEFNNLGPAAPDSGSI